MKNFLILFGAFFGLLILSAPAYAQPGCPTQTDVVDKQFTPVTCFGANDGTITVDIADAAVGAGAFNFDLYDLIAGAYVTLTVTETENTAARSVVYSDVPPGSYAVVFRRAGCPTLTITQGVSGFDITEPAELLGSVASITPACTPGTGAISLDVTGGNVGGYTYVWTGPTSIGNTVEDPTGLNAGTYSVLIEDTKGCSVSLTGIVVTPPPDATINAAGPFCETASPVNLTAATGGGTWSGPGITNATLGTFNPALAGPGTHSISYSIGGPCPASDSRNIVVSASPDPTITSTGPFCVTSTSVTLTAATPGGVWSGPGVSGGIFNPSAAGVGTHSITYTISGVCTVSDTENITVEASPNAAITPAGPFCQTASPVNLTAATPGGTWSGPGTNAAGQFNPATAGPGTHSISYSVTVGSCTATSNINIVVDASPNATITPAGPFCVTGSAVNLTAATPGGIWSGPGTNAAGSFNPVTASAGTHLISYSITVGACTSTSDINIVVDATPNAAITPAGPFCQTALPVNLTAATPGGTWSGPGTNAAGQFNPTTAGPGTHAVSYSVTVGACTSTSNINIVVDASPNAAITPAGPFCETASPVNLTAATPGGNWSGPGTSAAGQFNPVTAGVGTHVISYSVTVGTCASTSNININVAASPDPTITAAGPFCTSSTSVNLVAATPGGSWVGTGITDGVLGTFNPVIAGAGSHVITYTISGTCTVSDTETIVVQSPAPAAITSIGTLCADGAIVTLTASPAGGTWSGTGVNPATGEFDPAVSGSGTFTITYTVGVGACNSVDTENIQVNALPTASITGTTTICAGQSTGLSITLTGIGPWTVDYTDGSSSFTQPVSASPFTLNASPGSTTTYTLTSVSDATCTAAVTGSATVSVTTVVLTLDPATVCDNGGIIPLTPLVSATPAGGTFTFSGTGVTGAGMDQFDPTGLSGSVPVTVNYTSTGSCTDTGVLTLSVTNALTMTVPTTPVQICQGAGLVDLNTYVSGTSGPYTFSGNAAITGNFFDPAGLSGIQNIIVDYAGPGSCSAPQVNFDFDVVSTIPPLGITGTSLCANAGSFDLTTLVTAAIPGGSFSFTGLGVTGNTFNPAGITGPTTVSIGVTYSIAGCGSVSGTIPINVLDPATCLPNCFAFTVEVDPQTHRPSCHGGADGVIAIRVTAGTPQVLVTVYRQGDPVPVPLPDDSGAVFVFSNLSAGTYEYRLEDENGTYCVQPFVWEEVEDIQATVSDLEDSKCFGTPSGSAVINATGSSTGQYFYSVNGTAWTEFVPGNVVGGLPGDGTYNIRVGGSANDPCYATVSVTINQLGTAPLDTAYVSPVNGFPAVSYPETPTATRVIGIEGSGATPYEVRLQLVESFGVPVNPPFIIDWTEVDEFNPQSFIPQEQFDKLYAGEYELQLRDAAGCLKVFSFVINVDERIFIPNIFTPNKSDDLNSTFFVRNLPQEGSKLYITDRWGKEIYTSNNYNPNTLWDGGETPDGVYFYRLQIKGGKTYTGWVEILRGTKR